MRLHETGYEYLTLSARFYTNVGDTSVQKEAASRRYGPPLLRKLLYLAALMLGEICPLASRKLGHEIPPVTR
jgi:hypothetical protein